MGDPGMLPAECLESTEMLVLMPGRLGGPVLAGEGEKGSWATVRLGEEIGNECEVAIESESKKNIQLIRVGCRPETEVF